MKKLFLRTEFGPLWEPWEEDEIGRNKIFSELYTIKEFELRVVTFILNQTIVGT